MVIYIGTAMLETMKKQCLYLHLSVLACTGLVDETEVESMKDLVEQKLKKLHYFPPQFRVQPPHTMLAAHPLLADITDKAFGSQV